MVCHVHTLLLGREYSTIVEGQRLGRHRHVHFHTQNMYMYMYMYMCVLWCRVTSCVARRCWLGGLVWCGDVVVSNCVLVVLSSCGEPCRHAAFSCRGRLVGVVFSSCCRRFIVWWSLSEGVFLFRMISILQRARAERSMIELALFSKWLRSGCYLVNLWRT